MILPIVEMILALLRLICEIKLRQLTKSAEAKHGERAGQASHCAAAALNRPLKQLAVDIFHVLEDGDEPMLDRGTRNDARLGKHISIAAGFQLHLVHEVLYAMRVEDTVTVDEEHEEIVIPAKVVLIYTIDKAERLLLAATLASMWESRHCDAAAAVGNVDTSRKRLKGDRHT